MQVTGSGNQRSLTHAYLASVSFVDHCVGIVLDALEASSYADNTIIVLWSDHGFISVRNSTGPSVPSGKNRPVFRFLSAVRESNRARRARNPPACWTLPYIGGVVQPAQNDRLEGISLVPQLKDPNKARKQPAITSSYFGNHSIRTRDWRLISYEDGSMELYDHRTDPDEFVNLAKDPEHQDLITRLSKWLPSKTAPEFKEKSERLRARKSEKLDFSFPDSLFFACSFRVEAQAKDTDGPACS